MAQKKFWWVYDPASPRPFPRLVESEFYPGTPEVVVINHAFDTPAIALAVLQHYVYFRDDGIMELDMKRVNLPLTQRDRLSMIVRLAPLLFYVEVAAIVLSMLSILLLLAHLL